MRPARNRPIAESPPSTPRWPGPSPLRCLVTGASGYIGGRLVPELLAAAYPVRCMARDPGKLSGRPWSAQDPLSRQAQSDLRSRYGHDQSEDCARRVVGLRCAVLLCILREVWPAVRRLVGGPESAASLDAAGREMIGPPRRVPDVRPVLLIALNQVRTRSAAVRENVPSQVSRRPGTRRARHLSLRWMRSPEVAQAGPVVAVTGVR